MEWDGEHADFVGTDAFAGLRERSQCPIVDTAGRAMC